MIDWLLPWAKINKYLIFLWLYWGIPPFLFYFIILCHEDHEFSSG